MKIKIDGHIDSVDVDFEGNLLIVEYSPTITAALTLENPAIAEGGLKPTFRSRLDYVGLTNDERKQVETFINNLIERRASLTGSLTMFNGIKHVHGEDIS